MVRLGVLCVTAAALFSTGSCFDNHRKAPGPGQEKAPKGTPNIHCESTKGPFTIEMHPEWAPIGAARFLAAMKAGVYDGTVIYRVVRNEAVQFGYPKDPVLRKEWQSKPELKDDQQIFRNPNFHRGMISFAGHGKNSRGLDLFITFMTGNANGHPQAPWETPFGIIDEQGLKAVTSFTSEYGDFGSFGGHAPELGNGYEALKKSHPNIDYLGKCELVYPDGDHEVRQVAHKQAVVEQPNRVNRGNSVKQSELAREQEKESVRQREHGRGVKHDPSDDDRQREHGRGVKHDPSDDDDHVPSRHEPSASQRTSGISFKLGNVLVVIPKWLIVLFVAAVIVVKFVLPKRISRKITRLDF